MELVISNLTKRYGSFTAVDNISLRIGPGVYGLLGANGAGKSTLMRMLCGVIKPTEGTIRMNGMDVTSEEYLGNLGYLPQDFGYYPEFAGEEYLLYLAALKGISNKEAKRKAIELLELVGLADVRKKKIKTYSGGMKQRIGVAQALLNDPHLLIVDEPTAGLDPVERVRFRNLIASLGREGIVLVSTHIASDIEQIADTLLIMHSGKLVYNQPLEKGNIDLEAFYLSKFGGV